MPTPIAIVTADIHLSDKPPIARSLEPDWFDSMAKALAEVDALANEMSPKYNHVLPIVIAGDLFDKWNPSPALINLAMDCLPTGVCAIPGNHDLRYHDLEEVQNTGYGLLVRSGFITDLSKPVGIVFGRTQNTQGPIASLRLHGFPFGKEIVKNTKEMTADVNVAIVHKYVWTAGSKHPGAGQDGKASLLQKELSGFDIVVTGDNHIPFDKPGVRKKGRKKIPHLFNCGSLMRRSIAQVKYEPSVGIIMDDGSILRKQLKAWKSDKFIKKAAAIAEIEHEYDLSGFVDELSMIHDVGVDFFEEIRRVVENNKLPKKAIAKLSEYLGTDL